MTRPPWNRLLVLACSATKRELGPGEVLPLSELYDGPTWRVLRSHERDHGPVADRGVLVLALSAVHGLVPASFESPGYDRRLDRRRAIAREHETSGRLRAVAGVGVAGDSRSPGDVDEAFVVAGVDYLPALALGLDRLVELGVDVNVAAGGIGFKLRALRVWLDRLVEPARLTAGEHEPEADVVRRELFDDPFVSNVEYGELVEQAAAADEARGLAAELDPAELDEPVVRPVLARLPIELAAGDGPAVPPLRIDDAVIDDELSGRFEREVGVCVNHECRRFEYRVAVDGDVELAVCDDCSQRLCHESGLTWADAAAAGYRRETERRGNRA